LAKPKYAAECHRCNGKGYYPAKSNGACFACHGRKFVGVKSSKVETLYKHYFRVSGGELKMIKTWGRTKESAWEVAKNFLHAKDGIVFD
tara:strand:- start:2559 stop:2825 length:267 start_codon:yes stop_codon:yes gene_type:complete